MRVVWYWINWTGRSTAGNIGSLAVKAVPAKAHWQKRWRGLKKRVVTSKSILTTILHCPPAHYTYPIGINLPTWRATVIFITNNDTTSNRKIDRKSTRLNSSH